MKKTLALVLALLMVLALFAGCGNEPAPANATNAPAADKTAAPAKSDAPASSDPDSPYCLAAGRYEVDENGHPVSKYVYDAPLCTNDETLSYWTTCYTPQYIPEGGWGEIPTWQKVREYTGVHIEYVIVDSANRSQNFSVLLASDDLDDIMDGASSFYKAGTLKSAVEDGYFANMADYTEYLPNYMWEIYDRSKYNKNVLAKLYYDDETIPTLYGLVMDPCPAMGYFLRQDWMDKLGLGQAVDVKTYDQFHKVMLAFKSAYSTAEREIFPFFVNSNIENYQSCFFGGFDTTVYTTSMAYARVKNGTVEFCGATEDDRDAMQLLVDWYKEGLISPNYLTFVPGDSFDAGQHTDGLGAHNMPVSSWNSSERESENPECHWEVIPRTKKTEDQEFHYGYAKAADNYSYASCAVSGKCTNIPLAASWIDWSFSDFGADYVSFGEEGYLWEYNDKGERRLTEWCLTHEASSSWIMCIYGASGLTNCVLFANLRNYYYEGGDRELYGFEVLKVKDYKGEYDWPSACTFTDEERTETTALFADLNTYFAENYAAFVDGSKPMSDWDSYIDGLNSFGYERIKEIYQDAYARFQARSL